MWRSPPSAPIVDAGRTYHALSLGLGASFAGAVGVTPAAAVPVLNGTTSAHIYGAGSGAAATQVRARDTVEVSAVGAGALGAGVDVGVFHEDVLSTIDGATVDARGTVGVDALAQRTMSVDALAAAAGLVGLGGGGAVEAIGGALNGGYTASSESGSGAVTAGVGAGASVAAGGDVTVQATDTPTVDIKLDGGAVGAIAVGTMIGRVTIGTTVAVAEGDNARIRGASVRLEADSTPSATLQTVPLSGGILAGSGSDSQVTLQPTLLATVGNNAMIDSAGAVTIKTSATPTASGKADGATYGGVVVGISTATTTETVTNTASIGAGARINGGSVSLQANSTDSATATSQGSDSALVAISQAADAVNLTDNTAASVGDNAIVTAVQDLSIKAATNILAATSPKVDTGGLGTNGDAESTITVLDSVRTTIGAATLNADTIAILADVFGLNTLDGPESVAKALGADSTAKATDSETSNAQTTLNSGAQINGDTSVSVAARHDVIKTQALPVASTQGLGAKTDADASNILSIANGVTAAAGAAVQTRALSVSSDVMSRPVFDARTFASGAVIDVGSTSQTPVLNDARSIVWNSGVTLLSAPIQRSWWMRRATS